VRFADQNEQDGRIGRPTLAAFVLVVVAFMVLSLVVTATGTARFATSLGYDATAGYAVGAVFDIAKGILPVGVLALLARRAFGTAALLGIAWICLVTFGCLATHATVSTAISSIERTGTWQMERRGDIRRELASIEQQLDALSRPAPPRPATTVREALAAERVPGSVWQDSQECSRIQESAHFARACAQVVQLRRELAAALDYERLSSRAADLRKGLAEAPIVATSDPLPAAFSATLGRVLPMSGAEGIALLLTVVVELISCFGLAGLAVLSKDKQDRQRAPHGSSSPLTHSGKVETTEAVRDPAQGEAVRDPAQAQSPEIAQVIHFPSARARAAACPPTATIGLPKPARVPEGQARGQARPASLPAQRSTAVALAQPTRSPAQGSAARTLAAAAVTEFVALLKHGDGARATGSELFRAYATRRASYGWPELKPNTFGMHLKACVEAVGGRKFKSCGQVYEGVCIPPAWREPLIQSA